MSVPQDSLVTVHFNEKRGDAFLLKSAKTVAGFWLAQPPAIDVSSYDSHKLSKQLHEALASPLAVVPTPARNSFLNPRDLGIPFAQGWRAFENKFQTVTVARSVDATYEVAAYVKDGSVDVSDTHTYVGPDAFCAVMNDLFSRIGSTALSA